MTCIVFSSAKPMAALQVKLQKLPYALPVSGFGKRWYLQAVRVESVVRDLCLTENRDLQAIASQRRLYQIRPLLDTSTPPPHRFSSSVIAPTAHVICGEIG